MHCLHFCYTSKLRICSDAILYFIHSKRSNGGYTTIYNAVVNLNAPNCYGTYGYCQASYGGLMLHFGLILYLEYYPRYRVFH